MARWADIERSEPEFAAAVRRRLDAHVHKTIATLRADGAPRISGIETILADGELWIGSMPGARKALDLRRDPRYALHSGSADPPAWEGDAKVSGCAEEITAARREAIFAARSAAPPPPDSLLFRLEIELASLVRLNPAEDRLVIETWRPGRPLARMERA
jgi:Pyridoxamine 5'-phosphate oxidase